MSFALHFREHVLPDLHRLARQEAAHVAVGQETFLGAYSAIEGHARNRGALFLPEQVFTDLEDWIAKTLLAEVQTLEQQFTLLEANCRLKVALGPTKLL